LLFIDTLQSNVPGVTSLVVYPRPAVACVDEEVESPIDRTGHRGAALHS